MKKTREQKRAELRAEADRLIEEMLKWDEKTEAPTLSQIEDEVLQLREQFGRRLAEVVIEGQETVQLVEAPHCEKCGERMRYKGRKEIAPESRVGEIGIERGYYYCARCHNGLFPPRPSTTVAGSTSK